VRRAVSSDLTVEPPKAQLVAQRLLILLALKQHAQRRMMAKTINNDFPARGKAYREITQQEADELEQIAQHRHKVSNWLSGLAPANNWGATPVETWNGKRARHA